MYKQFYGLRERPFSIVPNPAMLYESRQHSQAMTYLRYGINEHIGFVLFTGEIGTGKTTLLKHLMSTLNDSVDVAMVFTTNVDAHELLRLILLEFEVDGVTYDKSKNLDLLYKHLINVFASGRRSLLVIDEAQNLSMEALEEVRLLSNLQTDTSPLLQIILTGQPKLRNVIASAGLEQLAQRVAISYHLSPLSRSELDDYINYRLERAGYTEPNLFSSEALDLVFEKSQGIPRVINIICNIALVYGYADSLKIIPPEVIQHAAENTHLANPQANNVPTEEGTHQISSILEGGDQTIEKRLELLESQIDKLSLKVAWHDGQIDGCTQKQQDNFFTSLRMLLEKERINSGRLLKKCILQDQENKALRKQLAQLRENPPATLSVEPLLPQNTEEVKPKWSFLNWLLGSK